MKQFELLPKKVALAHETFRVAQVEKRVQLVEGDAQVYLEQYDQIAFCFLDAEKEVYGVAVITRATGDISLAVAQELHSQGVRLALTGRSEKRLVEVQSELEAVILAGDITSPDLPGDFLELMPATYG